MLHGNAEMHVQPAGDNRFRVETPSGTLRLSLADIWRTHEAIARSNPHALLPAPPAWRLGDCPARRARALERYLVHMARRPDIDYAAQASSPSPPTATESVPPAAHTRITVDPLPPTAAAHVRDIGIVQEDRAAVDTRVRSRAMLVQRALRALHALAHAQAAHVAAAGDFVRSVHPARGGEPRRSVGSPQTHVDAGAALPETAAVVEVLVEHVECQLPRLCAFMARHADILATWDRAAVHRQACEQALDNARRALLGQALTVSQGRPSPTDSQLTTLSEGPFLPTDTRLTTQRMGTSVPIGTRLTKDQEGLILPTGSRFMAEQEGTFLPTGARFTTEREEKSLPIGSSHYFTRGNSVNSGKERDSSTISTFLVGTDEKDVSLNNTQRSPSMTAPRHTSVTSTPATIASADDLPEPQDPLEASAEAARTAEREGQRAFGAHTAALRTQLALFWAHLDDELRAVLCPRRHTLSFPPVGAHTHGTE